ncbi:MAG: hypothetical protein Q8P76_00510 [bacterium]|nr:hypothetical protein [bacterium]
MNDIFGENLTQEEVIIFTYKGDKFINSEIELSGLISELRGIEVLIRESVEFYRKKHRLSDSEVIFDIYVRVEDGSVKEVIRIIKKNATVLTLLGTFVMPFLQSGFDFYLNRRKDTNSEIVEILEGNKKIRKSFEDILIPITGNDNSVTINAGNVTYEINNSAKEQIMEELKKHEEVLSEKEIIKEEDLFGVISVSKLYDASPFSFRVNETARDIPLYFSDINFNLEEKQGFLGKELLIRARVTYKNDRRISITVLGYKSVAKLF